VKQRRGIDFSVGMAVHVASELRGNGGNAETTRAKVSFCTATICQVYHLITHIDRLQESSPEELKMHQNSWWPALRPGPHFRSLQRSSNPTWWLITLHYIT